MFLQIKNAEEQQRHPGILARERRQQLVYRVRDGTRKPLTYTLTLTQALTPTVICHIISVVTPTAIQEVPGAIMLNTMHGKDHIVCNPVSSGNLVTFQHVVVSIYIIFLFDTS